MTRVDTRAYKRRSYAASRQPLDGSTSLPVSKRTRVLVIYCSTFSGSRYIYLSLSDYVAAAVASAGSQCGSKSVFIVCDWTVRNHRLVAVMTIYGQDCRHGKTTRCSVEFAGIVCREVTLLGGCLVRTPSLGSFFPSLLCNVFVATALS